MQIIEEWCDKSEFTPDCDENKVKRTDGPKPPSSVSWMQIPYPLTSALSTRLAAHEEGTWTFPKDLIPTICEGTVLRVCMYMWLRYACI